MDILFELIGLALDLPAFYRRFGAAGCLAFLAGGVVLAGLAVLVAVRIVA
ncbi:MAG: hypothetical protein RIS86_2363 [Planctomycetota bacterium]